MTHKHHHHHHEDEAGKTIEEKLKILIHHWKEHNDSHLTEYKKWQLKAKEEGIIDIAEILEEVCRKVEEISKLYKDMEKLLS